MERPRIPAIPVLLGPGARGLFTTRTSPNPLRAWDAHYGSFNLTAHVGDDPVRVRVAREDLAAYLGLHMDEIAWMNQVHSAKVAVASCRPEPAPEGSMPDLLAGIPEADALVLDREDPVCAGVRALGVLVADCVPLLLASGDGRFLAAIHAGRKGMLAGIVPNALDFLRSRGAEMETIWAAIGPCICGACYEVPESMRAEAAAQEPDCYAHARQGTAAIDVAAGVMAQLERAGVGHIQPAVACTLEDDRFYSFRRDPRTGRLAGVVIAE